MWSSLTLFGALTSKPYAFKARPWELKSIETIDLFDSLCSNIRLDLRGSEIMRVLPINNEAINDEWISDKARYSFDGLKRERFINPMIKKNNIFIQTSWKEAFDFISTQIKNRKSNNLVINTGNFTDIQHSVSLHNFVNKIIPNFRPVINNVINLNADLQEYYTIKQDLFNFRGPKIILLIGTNLRLESPILNIKLKKLSTSNTVLIGYIGSNNNYNLTCEHLGNNISILTEITSGRHPFCSVITNFLKKNSKNNKISNIFKNSISVVFGNEIIQSNKHVNLIRTLKTIKNPFISFDYNVLDLYSGKINMLELGLFNDNKINIKENTIFYLLNNEILRNFKKGDFVIFQGDHNISLRQNLDVILPTVNWTEKSSLYLNCFGYIQKTQFSTLPPITVRSDWKITYMLISCFIDQNIKHIATSKAYLENINNLINIFSPNLMTFINKYKINKNQKIYLLNSNNTKLIFRKDLMPLKSFIFNYYQITSIEKASKVMDICSKFFVKKKLNFTK